jgi:hypothetical protein
MLIKIIIKIKRSDKKYYWQINMVEIDSHEMCLIATVITAMTYVNIRHFRVVRINEKFLIH